MVVKLDIKTRIRVFRVDILPNPYLPLWAKLNSMYRLSYAALRRNDLEAMLEVAEIWAEVLPFLKKEAKKRTETEEYLIMRAIDKAERKFMAQARRGDAPPPAGFNMR